MKVLIRSIIAVVLLGSIGLAASTSRPPAKKRTSAARRTVRKPYLGPAVDPTAGDNIDGDDLVIRRAAVDALGTLNGSIVVVDPASGRLLTMVNQKLALKSGFIPCSTIKLVTSIAALTENVVDRDTFIHTGRYVSYNLTTALARSNNQYFAVLGNRLGFDKVLKYAQMLGLGEKAGLNIEGEQAGEVPAEPPKYGGVGMMTSFGTGFFMTPLELAGLLSAVANNGTLYYLQYPRTALEVEQFIPKVKRTLEIAPNTIHDLKDGMRGAVDYGTARRANYDPSEPIFGKTGTCTDVRSANHMGWFGSFNEVGHNQIVVVVMLAGTHALSGPMASGVAGAFYRNLSGQRYFAADATPRKPVLPEILVTQPCCTSSH
jgi:cell division protein FtsI/penicillin-binding protein 2